MDFRLRTASALTKVLDVAESDPSVNVFRGRKEKYPPLRCISALSFWWAVIFAVPPSQKNLLRVSGSSTSNSADGLEPLVCYLGF
jgi:hypothetical protein